MIINKVSRIGGTITVPADKSITHRSVMFASLADGVSYVNNYLPSADCLSTITIFKQMGVNIQQNGQQLKIKGSGLYGLKKPNGPLNANNSGTTTRLVSGILAGQNFSSEIIGDESLSSRPMKRIIIPLRQMNANICAKDDNFLPIKIDGNGSLKAISYKSPVSSAQVKSCVLLAGLYADGQTFFEEPEKSRDHTETMLKAFGADISVDNLKVSVKKCERLFAREITVPSDISSAAFFIAAGLIIKNSNIVIKQVNVNKTRSGIITILKNMGGNISISNLSEVSGEAVADIEVKSSSLHGTNIDGSLIPSCVDEIPVIALCATQAEGVTVISGAKELRLKESDRLKLIATQLNKMGANIKEKEDGLIITGPTKLTGCSVETLKDHRMAMMLSVAGLCADGQTKVADSDCVNISFSNFYDVLKQICK